MTTLKSKLLRAFFVIIGLLFLVNIGSFLLHFIIVEKYKAVSDRMVAEYALVNAVPELIAAYNSRFQSTNINEEVENNKILAAKETITEKINFLDTNIIDPNSRSSYLGLKNTIAAVVEEVDGGLAELESGNITGTSVRYEEANKKFLFAKENGNKLLFSELSYIESTQKEIDNIYYVTSLVNSFIVIVVGLSSIVYAFRFANKITFPLRKLTTIAEEVATGNMQSIFDQALLERNDEIGTLSRSYSVMLTKLTSNISELDASNKKFKKISEENIKKNTELEEMNKFMVNRELRMIELKKKIKEYEAKIIS